jgi:hypothetical protein
LSRGPGIPQFGLVVEQVEKVNPDLVARDEQGKPYTGRYEAVNAMLLNEFLKEHRKVEELEKGMAVLTAQLKKQSAQIQKVGAQTEASKARGASRQQSLKPRVHFHNQPSRFAAWRPFVWTARNAHHSLKSPACSCLSIMLSALSHHSLKSAIILYLFQFRL